MKGKLIVFEGIDGAGTETQSKLLLEYFKKKKMPVERIFYPDYTAELGKLIQQFLHKKRELSPEMQFVLYAGDMVKDREKIRAWLEQGKTVISDRYFNSTIVYQGLRGFKLEKALRFAEDFGIPKPDIVILLKISPEESARRKMGENGKLDRHEEDIRFLELVNDSYHQMAMENVFGRWFIINGERPKKAVCQEVLKVLKVEHPV
jgi:dTMP kinase